MSLCSSKINLANYKGVILIGGYAMDRLRYQTKITGSKNTAPAVELLRQAVHRMDAGKIVIGTICHSLWLFYADPALLTGRKVTCAHNIVNDVQNAGGEVIMVDGETADTHADGLLITGRHPAAIDAFNDLFLKIINAL